VEEPLPSGFTGSADPPGPGTARFIASSPEHVVIDVDAPLRGFVVLADSYYPGWRATVNGTAVPIARANFMSRLVEVPPGKSRVEFRYRPTSLVLGAAVSVAVLGGLTVFLVFRRRGRGHGGSRGFSNT